MDIDPKLLRYLLAIHRAGSFVRAAELLGISQPALSVAISRLEDVLGIPLVERGRHGAKLNAGGKVLLRHAISLENTLQLAHREVEHFNRGVHGPLAIGGTPLAMVSIIPEATALLTEKFGDLSVRIVEGADESLLRMLENHELDVVISNMGLRERPASISSTPLFEARTVAVVRPSHALAEHKDISLFELLDYTWVMPPEGGAFRQLIDALLATNGIAYPSNHIEADQFATLKRIVKFSDTVTLLSDQIVREELAEGTLVALKLREKSRPRLFGLHVLSNHQQNPVAEYFTALVMSLSPNFNLGRVDKVDSQIR